MGLSSGPGLSLGNIKGTVCLLLVGGEFRPHPQETICFQDLPQFSKRLELKEDWRSPSPTPPFPDKEPETLRGGDTEPTLSPKPG